MCAAVALDVGTDIVNFDKQFIFTTIMDCHLTFSAMVLVCASRWIPPCPLLSINPVGTCSFLMACSGHIYDSLLLLCAHHLPYAAINTCFSLCDTYVFRQAAQRVWSDGTDTAGVRIKCRNDFMYCSVDGRCLRQESVPRVIVRYTENPGVFHAS